MVVISRSVSLGVLLHICKFGEPSPADHATGTIEAEVFDSRALSSGLISLSFLYGRVISLICACSSAVSPATGR